MKKEGMKIAGRRRGRTAEKILQTVSRKRGPRGRFGKSLCWEKQTKRKPRK